MNETIKSYHKLFSIQEANKSLILVSKIVGDITKTTNTLQILKTKLSTIPQENITQSQLQEIKSIAEKLMYHYSELESLGVILINYHPIVIGFPTSNAQSEIDILTWRPGQIEVSLPKELVK